MVSNKDIYFGDELETSIFLDALKKKVRIVLSDDLEASEQVLTEEYKEKLNPIVSTGLRCF